MHTIKNKKIVLYFSFIKFMKYVVVKISPHTIAGTVVVQMSRCILPPFDYLKYRDPVFDISIVSRITCALVNAKQRQKICQCKMT